MQSDYKRGEMAYQGDRVQNRVSHSKLHENDTIQDHRVGSKQQQGITATSITNAGHINSVKQKLRWEKVPVIRTGSNNSSIRVISSSQINGPQWMYNSPVTDTWFHAPNQSMQELNFSQSPQNYLPQSQSTVQPKKIVQVPLVIETSSKYESIENSTLPVVNAKVSHNYEVVQATLVHPGCPLGSYSSHTFTIDESELRNFDPFKKQEFILSSLNIDVPRFRGRVSNQDEMLKEASLGPENHPDNKIDNNDDDIEIMIDTAPHPRQLEQQEQHHKHHPQHPLSPSKSSAGDLKSCNLLRKPSIRRKSNPLAAFWTGSSKEAKKSSKGKPSASGALPTGFKIRERGCSLTRCPTDSRTRHDQPMGNPSSLKNTDPLSDAWTDYIENTYEKFDVVLRKEEEGYGIQLHGKQPVVVDYVRPGGGAAKNGIMKGDIIFKVDDPGPFICLTLLRAPQSGLNDNSKDGSIFTLFAQSDKISNPSPAARDKNRELEMERLLTLKSMYDKAISELEQLKMEVQRNPDDLMMAKWDKYAKLVSQLEREILQVETSQPLISAHGMTSGHSQLPKLSIPGESGFGSSHPSNNSVAASEIISMEGLDNPVEEDIEVMIQFKEFEDFELLKQSPIHLACFLKYLIQSSNPSYMLFHTIANYYVQSSLKESSLSLRWAFEIYLTFLCDRSPLPLNLNPSIAKFVELCLGSGKDIRSIFQSALSSAQEQIIKQLEEFQHQRTLGLGNFFGEEYLPKPRPSLGTCSSFTAPVSYQASSRPPLSIASSTNPTTSSRGNVNLSSSSFSYAKSFGNNASDSAAIEKILWEVFESCFPKEDAELTKPDEMRPAIVASLATFFRHQGVTLSRQNQLTLEGIPSFVCRDKKAMKGKLKNHIAMNGHNFVPHQCTIMSILDCIHCSFIMWGPVYQGYKCHYCDVSVHKNCMKLASLPPCTKVPSKQKSGREEFSSTFYTDSALNFNSLPLRKKKKGLDDGFGSILSDSENMNLSELDLVASSAGTPLPGSTPSLMHLSSYDIDDSDMDVEQDLPPLSKVIPEDALTNLVGVARKKQEIINELFYTERSHVKSLLITIHYYLRPMKNDFKIDKQLVDLLFPNLESIAQWHKELSREFKARRNEQVVVQEVGDILLKMFSGQTGLRLQENCAEFCKDQLVNLELLKNRRKQDPYLNQFIMTTMQKDICKKQDLKDRLPKVMQRLTKYPLLFDNLLKITPIGTEEHARLLRALKNIRMILDHINETVRESENARMLLDLQRRMDARHMENENHPALAEFKNLQLSDHKLRHYGRLTWNASVTKNIELFLALFQDLLVIFQMQDQRLVLKCEVTGQDSAKFIFVPILKLGNLLVKDAPRTTRTFYLINASKEASQMYTLTAKTKEEREEWMRQISDTTEEYKRKLSPPSSLTVQTSKPSVLTETTPCYEFVETETADVSQEPYGEPLVASEQEDVTDGTKEEADYDDDDDDDDEHLNNDHTPTAWNPEKELKRQIIATHELMMDKIKALSELHNIESPCFHLTEKAILLDTDSDTFISTMDGTIEDMTNFFASLPDVIIGKDGPAEWDPVESLLELGQRLEMLVRQLETHVLQKITFPDVPPPPPTSEPPPLSDDDDGGGGDDYVESNF